ncbi:DMT family transporter [Mycetocola zhadangensis]|uniref:DMT family transporter n=1 Tax=Mycetocola zhadangensis TaxID=1164595 RepID=A0A3L7J6S2_9MICO|nr:DMT family transporter [Mycetocola zhadangensis]RLQ84202.1 DMT family transporter [Mycetocola zhadangensis]
MSAPLPAAIRPTALSPLVLVAIAVTLLAWASAFIVIRDVGSDFTAGALSLLRLLVGTVLLALLLIGRRWVRPTKREWLLILGFGITWFGAYNFALNTAEQSLDAGTTAMIVNLAPILVALGAGLFLREGLPKWLAIGAGVAFIGVVLIGVGAGGHDGGVDGIAVLWALLAAVTYAAGVLFQKPALKRLPAAQVTWLGCVIGTIACLPFTGQLIADIQQAPASSILGVVYLGAVPTAIAFSTWAYALSRVPAGQLTISTYIVPPLAILLGALFLGEVPVPLAIVGGILCLVGVALTRRRGRPINPAQSR